MTSNFADFESDFAQGNSETENFAPDCFELLSAYIDGELSPKEKVQVQTWLDHDPQVKKLYTQLMGLQGQMQRSVAPPSERSVAEITAEVFHTIDIDRRRNWQRKLVWGGGAIAASFLAAMSGMIPGINSSGLQIADFEPATNSNPQSVMLAVSVNKPAINIPKSIEGYYFESEDYQN